MRKTCSAHRNHKAGCQACKDAATAYRLAHYGTAPDFPRVPRTEADDVYVAALVAELRPLDTYDLARRCELILRIYHGPDIDVRPERRAA